MNTSTTRTDAQTKPVHFKQMINVPTRKVVSATLASVLATIFVWAFNSYVSPQAPCPTLYPAQSQPSSRS